MGLRAIKLPQSWSMWKCLTGGSYMVKCTLSELLYFNAVHFGRSMEKECNILELVSLPPDGSQAYIGKVKLLNFGCASSEPCWSGLGNCSSVLSLNPALPKAIMTARMSVPWFQWLRRPSGSKWRWPFGSVGLTLMLVSFYHVYDKILVAVLGTPESS